MTKKKLVDVADLDKVLGYKGNYTIFALKENNYITLHMMQDYLDVGDELTLRDPDELRRLHARGARRSSRTCVNKHGPGRCSANTARSSSSC